MMKRGVAMMTVLAMMGMGVPGAFAQVEDTAKPLEQVIDIEGMEIDGEFKRPDIHKGSANQRAKFKRISSLKKSMIKQVIETSESDALK